MTDWHEVIGKRLISIDRLLQQMQYEKEQQTKDINTNMRELTTVVENLTQEFYMLRTEIKKININLDILVDLERDMKLGVDSDEIYT